MSVLYTLSSQLLSNVESEILQYDQIDVLPHSLIVDPEVHHAQPVKQQNTNDIRNFMVMNPVHLVLADRVAAKVIIDSLM